MKKFTKSLVLVAIAFVAMVSCTEKPEIVPNDTIPQDTETQDTTPVAYDTICSFWMKDGCMEGKCKVRPSVHTGWSTGEIHWDADFIWYDDSTIIYSELFPNYGLKEHDWLSNPAPFLANIFYYIGGIYPWEVKDWSYEPYPCTITHRYEIHRDTLILNPGDKELVFLKTDNAATVDIRETRWELLYVPSFLKDTNYLTPRP